MNTTQFDQQFTSTLALLSRALRSGYNMAQTFQIIVDHAPEPTRSVFQNVLERIGSGATFQDTIDEMTDNVPSAYLKRITIVMNEQRVKGGNLALMIDELNLEFYGELGDDGWAKAVDLEDGYDVEQHYPLK